MDKFEFCPVCDKHYLNPDDYTSHHVFYPKRNYRGNITVNMCSSCHRQFNKKYKFDDDNIPTMKECIGNLKEFCKEFDKDAWVIYPQLRDYL